MRHELMTAHEFAIYDIVRRIEEEQNGAPAHQIDIAALAVREGVVEETGIFQAVDAIRSHISTLVSTGVLERFSGISAFNTKLDLLTVMAMRL